MTDFCCSDFGKMPKDVSKVLFVDVHDLCDELPPLDVETTMLVMTVMLM